MCPWQTPLRVGQSSGTVTSLRSPPELERSDRKRIEQPREQHERAETGTPYSFVSEQARGIRFAGVLGLGPSALTIYRKMIGGR